jgi:hypothetical protein
MKTTSPAMITRLAAMPQLTGGNEGNRANRGYAGWQHIPHQHVLDGEERVGRRRDAARKRAWGTGGEEAVRVSREMAEKVPADVAGHAHERRVTDPARQAPQEIVSGDEADEKGERQPRSSRVGDRLRQEYRPAPSPRIG